MVATVMIPTSKRIASVVRHVVTLTFAVLAIGIPAAAQTAEELVARNLEARGGLERLRGVEALRMTGSLVTKGEAVPATITMKRPNLLRQELRLQGRTIVQAFDGTRAWMLNPLVGLTTPQPIPAPPEAAQRGGFDGPLVGYEARGATIAHAGSDRVEGVETRKLRVTEKDGTAQTLFLDAKTFLEVKSEVEMKQGGRSARVESFFSDFRTVDGITMPHRVSVLVDGAPQQELRIDKIELGPALDDGYFSMPKGR
jgi:outer membrane lipoprotein-sorting protein